MAHRTSNGAYNVRIYGASELSERLGRLSDEIKDFRPCWPKLAPRLLDAIRSNISSQGSNVQHPWPQLNAKYKKSKQSGKKRFAGGLLVRTGKLLSSIQILSQTVRALKIGVRSKYAQAMNFGSTDNKSLPRPFIYSQEALPSGFKEAAQKEINAFIKKLVDQVNAAGSRISNVQVKKVA